jgi:hypothetical protein
VTRAPRQRAAGEPEPPALAAPVLLVLVLVVPPLPVMEEPETVGRVPLPPVLVWWGVVPLVLVEQVPLPPVLVWWAVVPLVLVGRVSEAPRGSEWPRSVLPKRRAA